MRLYLLSSIAFGVVGIAAFAHSGHDAEQVVRNSPDAVYSAFSSAIGSGSASGTAEYGSGKIAYEIEVKRETGKRIDLKLLLNKAEAGQAHFTFSPQNGGAETLVSGDVDVDQSVLRAAFADGPNGRIAEIPDFAYSLGMKKMLHDAGKRIESGMPLGDPGKNLVEVLDQQGRQEAYETARAQEEQSYRMRADVTKPMVDPNESARRYLGQN